MAKDFSNIKIERAERVNSMIEQATGKKQQQATASPEEVRARQNALKTQGRKGAKAKKIYISITPENYKFIRVYAASTGQTMAEAFNQMIDYARTDEKFLDAALKRLEALKNDIKNFTNPQEDEI